MVTLTCLLDDFAKVGLTGATIRRSYEKRGAIATLELIAGRTNNALQWLEGPQLGTHPVRHECTVIAVFIGYCTIRRPDEPELWPAAREHVARNLLELYVRALEEDERAIAEAMEQLPEHLRPRDRAEAPDDDRPPAPVAPLPAGGLKDLFTGEVRQPVYSDEPRESRPPQRKLL